MTALGSITFHATGCLLSPDYCCPFHSNGRKEVNCRPWGQGLQTTKTMPRAKRSREGAKFIAKVSCPGVALIGLLFMMR
jgi:hypothetical protein